MAKVAVLPLSMIEENPLALRTQVDKDNLAYQELKSGIKAVGLLNPISVREYEKSAEMGGGIGYRLVDGLHRKTAMQDLGFNEVPVNIVTVEDSDLLATQIIGNQHVKTTKTQFAQALKQLIQHKGLTLKEVCRTVAKSEKWVSDQLGLLDLPESLHPLVNDGKISVANALSLRKVKDRLDEFLQAAMTESHESFGPRVEEAVKEARKAALQGRKPSNEFKPVARVRKPQEVRAIALEVETTGHSPQLKSLFETQGLKYHPAETKALLEWFFHLDPVSVAAEQAKWEADKRKKEEDKKKREAEAQAKKDAAAKEVVKEITGA